MGVNMPDLRIGQDERKPKSVSDCILQNAKRQSPSYYEQVMDDLYGHPSDDFVPSPSVVSRPNKHVSKRLSIPVEDDTLLGGFSGLGRISEQEARRYDKHMADLGLSDAPDENEYI